MGKTVCKSLLIAALLVSLSACGLFRKHVSKFSDVRIRSTEQAAIDSANSLSEGQAMLAKGNYGSAISAFHLALLRYPESGMAANGLAIAYDSIGRPDLAEHYFEQAMGLEPDNASYRRNFARFASMNAARATALAANDAAAPTPERDAARSAPALTRVSLGEVRLDTEANRGPQLAYGAPGALRPAAAALRRARASPSAPTPGDLKQAVALAERRIVLARQAVPKTAAVVASRAD